MWDNMKNITTIQDNGTKKSFFYEMIVALNSEKVTFKKWNLYFNLLKGSIEGGLSLEHALEFATALDNADVIFISEVEMDNYNQSKEHLKAIINSLESLKVSESSELIVPEIKR